MIKIEFFPWKEEYSVQVAEIDNQHKVLVGLLNKLYDAFMKKEHTRLMGEFITELTDYACTHFKTEERYFRKFNYAETEKHIGEHNNFTQKVSQFKTDFEQGKIVMSMTIMNFLREWLTNHIMVSDKKYIDCFHKNGLK
jgi:hemerythrin